MKSEEHGGNQDLANRERLAKPDSSDDHQPRKPDLIQRMSSRALGWLVTACVVGALGAVLAWTGMGKPFPTSSERERENTFNNYPRMTEEEKNRTRQDAEAIVRRSRLPHGEYQQPHRGDSQQKEPPQTDAFLGWEQRQLAAESQPLDTTVRNAFVGCLEQLATERQTTIREYIKTMRAAYEQAFRRYAAETGKHVTPAQLGDMAEQAALEEARATAKAVALPGGPRVWLNRNPSWFFDAAGRPLPTPVPLTIKNTAVPAQMPELLERRGFGPLLEGCLLPRDPTFPPSTRQVDPAQFSRLLDNTQIKPDPSLKMLIPPEKPAQATPPNAL